MDHFAKGPCSKTRNDENRKISLSLTIIHHLGTAGTVLDQEHSL